MVIVVRDIESIEYINLKERVDREGGDFMIFNLFLVFVVLSVFVFLQMFVFFEKEFRVLFICSGLVFIQDLDSNCGDGLERECFRKLDQKLSEFYGVGDFIVGFFFNSFYLFFRGGIIKWFWDLVEVGYRIYYMDEYDEDKNFSVSEVFFLRDLR